jgi:hypothetical protein
MNQESKIIHLPANSRGLIIDAACFAAEPFECAEANYAALFAVCNKLFKHGVPFLCMLDRSTLNTHAKKDWSFFAQSFIAFFPWFHRNLAGTEMSGEIRRASISLNANIVSARLPLTVGQPAPLNFKANHDVLVLPGYKIHVEVPQSLEAAAEELRQSFLSDERRRKKHIIWANQQLDLEAA